ncbi:hypothetical protein FQZ97_755450 [compost metagenome]
MALLAAAPSAPNTGAKAAAKLALALLASMVSSTCTPRLPRPCTVMLGTSSTMSTVRVPVPVLPLASVTWKVKVSVNCRLLPLSPGLTLGAAVRV